MSITGTRRDALLGIVGFGLTNAMPRLAFAREVKPAAWAKLPTEPYPGKQDDIVFVDRQTGWYGNGKGRLYATRDGGDSWTKLLDRPGTFIRALGFIDAQVGILGNIGPGSFPGVTDTTPLYRTTDGGSTWTPVTQIEGPTPKGVCAIDVLRQPFVNSGVLDHRVTIRAGGRVGGPAHLLTSTDLGRSWISRDMAPLTAMILDVHFVTERMGFIAGASDADVEVSNAIVLKTVDGGTSWRRVYQSKRPFEITWKLSFPSRRVGYVTVQNYNPDEAVAARVVAKTTDGGETWTELPLATDHKLQELGIGFVDERRGWVGGSTGGYETRDGGRSWTSVDIGRAVNKLRIVRDALGKRILRSEPKSAGRISSTELLRETKQDIALSLRRSTPPLSGASLTRTGRKDTCDPAITSKSRPANCMKSHKVYRYD